ncbi:sialate O-acetylesterase [Sphingomonas sp. M1-B02]|uniref:sialate O-acetylesterase n=1 Tax=Sphingomonas sp. M1-B02 TaxID=3114300 RepID=UPI00223FD43F|nr:sialate O-acetylesterase [Sphingomonas sp. S6-11]UZK67317.1 sialate O-acetylesterase [Sphingomonas sp. S6-11]
MRVMLIKLALGIVALGPPTAAATTQDGGAAEVYVLAGQSNMSGRGSLDELTPAEEEADPAIRVYGNDGVWKEGIEPLDDARKQVDAVSADAQAGVGPGLFFAREIHRLRRRPIIVIPCAKGGSSIGRWKPAEARDTLYGSCLARIREAGGRVSGILWYQGESDADTPERAGRWAQTFTALVAQFRKDLGQAKLPIAFVQIADPARSRDRAVKYPAWIQLQNAQRKVALPCVTMVAAAGLPLNQDELHLTTEAHRSLGIKLARTMDQLQRRRCAG